jgi:hypothetical protein
MFNADVDPNSSVFRTLKTQLEKKGFEVLTIDDNTHRDVYRMIFYNTPFPWDFLTWKKIIASPGKCVLMMIEPPIVNPFNYFSIINRFFFEVRTWNSCLVDGKRYLPYNIGQADFGIGIAAKGFSQKKLLILINGNKVSPWPLILLSKLGLGRKGKELYSERIKVIEYFDKHHPEKFDLYGRGWNRVRKYDWFQKILGAKKYGVFRGETNDKIELLSGYKFCLCFENMTHFKGYLTEKIFDCLKAKCVPVYWGATDVGDFVPTNCFIDYRRFKSLDDMLEFLENMDQAQYDEYVRNIEGLLRNQEFVNFWFEPGWCEKLANDLKLV